MNNVVRETANAGLTDLFLALTLVSVTLECYISQNYYQLMVVHISKLKMLSDFVTTLLFKIKGEISKKYTCTHTLFSFVLYSNKKSDSSQINVINVTLCLDMCLSYSI